MSSKGLLRKLAIAATVSALPMLAATPGSAAIFLNANDGVFNLLASDAGTAKSVHLRVHQEMGISRLFRLTRPAFR